MMDLTGPDVEHLMAKGMSFARVIWLFYGAKAGFEAQYKALIDLGMHRLPCRKLIRNAGFYAVATLTHTLGVAVDLIGGRSIERGSVATQASQAATDAFLAFKTVLFGSACSHHDTCPGYACKDVEPERADA
jgi:hypothetical protein